MRLDETRCARPHADDARLYDAHEICSQTIRGSDNVKRSCVGVTIGGNATYALKDLEMILRQHVCELDTKYATLSERERE